MPPACDALSLTPCFLSFAPTLPLPLALALAPGKIQAEQSGFEDLAVMHLLHQALNANLVCI